jgi:ankyrin repeat protein
MGKSFFKTDIDINRKNRLGNTALECAFYGGYYDIAELLIQNDADINALFECGDITKSHNARTYFIQGPMLIYLVLNKNFATLEFLSKNAKDLDINKPDGYGNTALYYARKKGPEYSKYIKFLQQYKAKDSLELARETSDVEC